MKSRGATKTALIGHVPGVRGGDPTILGTRISVVDIVQYARLEYEELGFGTDQSTPPLVKLLEGDGKAQAIVGRLLVHYPHLTAEQITAAWQYFLDNEGEIRILIEEEEAAWRAHE